MKREYLPVNLGKIYLVTFLIPLLLAFLVLLFFRLANPANLLIIGFIFVSGELFFISKAEYGKKVWLYADIIFLFECFILLMLYFKIFES